MDEEIDEEGEELSAEAIALWIMGVIADSDPYPDVINFRPLDKEAFLLKTKYGEEFTVSVEKRA
ncbi:hypothetical protein UFOVP760_35 [uncultured Caudovirales phage]|uniref:Uncharacterized protein n=1 Tax=uncultured Caudovirales phage TaxID=2100421 RepID=A0A6J7X6J7_9CAUD|nr:hypothetical protein UFOVP760_35 [uncultured Caudovirales phage]